MIVPAPHPSDGSDEQGRDLTVTIRLGPDGRVYFHDITADTLPIAAALCPGNAELERRLAAARGFAATAEGATR